MDNYVECLELAGKTIASVKIYRDTGDGTEVQIDLTDGTSFNCCFGVKTSIEASTIRAGVGAPETLKKYDLS